MHIENQLCAYSQVEMCRMPALTITLSLDHACGQGFEEKNSDIVAFVSGLLLGNDQQVRNWFAMFVRNRQKVIVKIYCFTDLNKNMNSKHSDLLSKLLKLCFQPSIKYVPYFIKFFI